MKFIEQIFSVKNENAYKVITFLGIKVKFKRNVKLKDLMEIKSLLYDLANKQIELDKKIEAKEMKIEANEMKMINEISETKNLSYNIKNNVEQIYWRTRTLNIGINNIFQYMTGIELNNDFIMEREIVFDPKRVPIDHYNRYSFAVENISENDSVADIACTCGYGSSMLAGKAKKVVGVDINQAVINFANKIFKKENLGFYCQDAQNLNLTEELDAVVSFETIEHIKEPELFLNKIHSLLKVGGKIICSVPNETTRPWANEGNNFHYRHYTKEQFTELLTNCGFSVETMYQQYDDNGYKIEQKEHEGQMLVAIAKK